MILARGEEGVLVANNVWMVQPPHEIHLQARVRMCHEPCRTDEY